MTRTGRPKFAEAARWRMVAVGLAALLGTYAARVGAPRAHAVVSEQSKAQHEPPDFDPADIDLETAPFDRIELRNGTVYECEPVQPRPLVNMTSTSVVEIRPTDAGAEMVQVGWRAVRSILYFEDMLLQKAGLLLDAHQFDDAFDYLQAVRRRSRNWPGLSQSLARLLMGEARDLLTRGETLRAVNLLFELHRRDRNYPDLLSYYDTGMSRLLDRARRDENYHNARWLLHRSEQQIPGRPVVADARSGLIKLARQRVDEAVDAGRDGDLARASHLAYEASLIWPELPGLQQELTRAFDQHAFIVIAVQQLAQPSAQPHRTPAQQRTDRLVFQSLIAPSATPEPESYSPQFARSYETGDLGRRISFDLRLTRLPPNGGTSLTALDVAHMLAQQSDPAHPHYRPAWAGLRPDVRVESLGRLTVGFLHPPLRPEALFQFPLVARPPLQATLRTLQQSSVTQRRSIPVEATGAYRAVSHTASRTVFGRNPGALRPATEPGIHELIEHRFDDIESALRALVRGRVTLIEHVAPFRLAALSAHADRIAVATYAVPTVHTIAFDFRNPALRNRTLRRAMVYAIDRGRILGTHLTGGNATQENTVLSGPFRHDSSYARSSVEPRPHNAILAAALTVKARKELGGTLRPLKLHHPPEDVARMACRHIRDDLQGAGIEVQLVERNEFDLAQDLLGDRPVDLVYRITTTREPIVETPRLLSLATSFDDPAQHVAGPWLRQLLDQLRKAPDMPAARQLLQEIHQVVHDQVTLIPLWQMTDYFAYDKRLEGLSAGRLDLYQDVEQWRFEPSVPQDFFTLLSR